MNKKEINKKSELLSKAKSELVNLCLDLQTENNFLKRKVEFCENAVIFYSSAINLANSCSESDSFGFKVDIDLQF